MAEMTMTEAPLFALMPDQEEAAIQAARQDRRAFSSLYRAHIRPIYRYLYSRLGQAGEAEDLTSQVFIEALESLPRYTHRGHFQAWLFSIARHRLLNFQQRRYPERDIEISEDLEGDFPDPLAQVLRNEEKQNLLRLIHALKEEDQDLLRLRFVAELSYAEIGALLERKEETVKKQVYRLLDRLQSQLEKDDD